MSEERFIKAVGLLTGGSPQRAYEEFAALSEESASDYSGMAVHYLAWMYDQGVFVAKDPRKAFELWYKAALKGVPHSQEAVGDCYFKGIGVEKSEVNALAWYLVAQHGGKENELGPELTANISKIWTSLGPEEQAHAEKLAAELAKPDGKPKA